MKFSVTLLLALSILAISIVHACEDCNWNANLHCGQEADDGCMVTGINRCMVKSISCKRSQRGLKPLEKITEGRCPTDGERCRIFTVE